ncbi:MAG: 1-acyl-sn-glycerol-3-phosphate acyltransferase [Bacteroidota bacterium]
MKEGQEIRLSVLEDAEVQAAVQELFSSPSLLKHMQRALPTEIHNLLLAAKAEVHSTADFQEKMMLPFLRFVERYSMTGISVNGLEQLDPQQKYLFISNHRDIGLDSAFLNKALYDAGFTTTQIAIGDNLMTHRLAELIFRINKSFAVLRSGTPRELYSHSIRMSSYIHEMIQSGQDSIWIAQREGRAKDGNDFTQVGILKMLSLSKQDDLVAHFKELNIVPVAISYEYDPTALAKTLEHLQKLENPDYKKSFKADIQHIIMGIFGPKGQVHLHFGKPLNASIDQLNELPNDKKRLAAMVEMIDQSIHQNYGLHAINYAALDLMEGRADFDQHYSNQDRETAITYFKDLLTQVPKGQYEEGKEYLLGMYANPVRNRGVK